MKKITIIGLGYVGLPLAVEFGKKFSVVGFDINSHRVDELNKGEDRTLEINSSALNSVLKDSPNESIGLYCTSNNQLISKSNYYIITVPTPVDENNEPDLTPLIKATELVASVLKKGDYIIYESTVFPGATEDVCNPILETVSKLKLNKDYFLGYSPERINPGDKEKTLTKILKITSGSDSSSALNIDNLYKTIITAGTYLAPSIKVAEAAKVIENSQRDINIAFVNELAKIFNLLSIDTMEVLKAAGTKWNFLPFKPGLVGGHCIGVDPYYLAMIAKKNGYNPDIILSGRRLNDSMGKYVASEVIKLMITRDIKIKNASILILGITFKENCPDHRNTKVIDVVNELKDHHCNITIYDPWASPIEIKNEYNMVSTKVCPNASYDAIILTVSHDEFSNLNFDKLKNKNSVLYDVKGFLGNKSDKKL
jgi:UDP-N-acetyl-D-glucosamine/UDP-N-acetyl-D-galactosamine dehydrogenase